MSATLIDVRFLPPPRQPRKPRVYPAAMFCATPGCGMRLTSHNRSGLRGSFCRQHAAQLARVRERLETEPRGYRIWGTNYAETD